MEEAAPVGRGCLLQPASRGDRNHTSGCHRNPRVAMGTRGPKTERHPFDASGDGMPIERSDLRGVVHPCKNPTEPARGPARIPLADRGGGRSHRRTDRTPRRLSQRSEWTRIGAVMNHQVPKYVTRARASLMLGIPETELNRIS